MSLTVMVNTFDALVFEEVVGTKVEKKPPARGWHGSAKEDCVTEWFCGVLVFVFLGGKGEGGEDVPLRKS